MTASTGHALGIIGGSGLDYMDGLQVSRQETVATPYGEPSAPLSHGTLQGRAIVFMPRHGSSHAIAPHRINYRANLWALQAVGVRDVVAVCAVGGISEILSSGSLVVPDQIIDYTHGREASYFDGLSNPLDHIDFTMPFCEDLRAQLLEAGRFLGIKVHSSCTYGATQGPRLETAAEIRRMARDGAHIVGMTGMPEAALARELGLCYAMVAAVVNPAAGCGGSAQSIALADIHAVAAVAMRDVCRLIVQTVCHVR